MHNDHDHQEATDNNASTSTVLSPIGCDDATYWYRIQLRVTDPQGLSDIFIKNIYPNCTGTQQTISFAAIPDKLVSDAPFTINPTASSGLTVFTYVIEGPALLMNNEVTLTGDPGMVTIRAAQHGDATYQPATPVEQSFMVHPRSIASQTINFPAIPDKQTSDPPFTLNATASSGLSVTYAVLSGPATVNGNTVTLTGATGTVTIRAYQSGDLNFYPAATVDRSFNVGPGCTDNDGDGVCQADDCDDNDPSIPTTPGTPCDDGNPNTENDVIQADGCTCQGTPVINDCSGVSITTGPGQITVDGLVTPITQVQIFDPFWAFVLNCSGNCNNPSETVSNLADGTYYVKVRLYDASWGLICEVVEYVLVAGTPCTDNDNDGICEEDDCDDNDPTLPTTPGTPCDDGDPNTPNDVIQADGCTCLGCTDNDGDGVCQFDDCDDNDPSLPTTPGTSCNDGDPQYNQRCHSGRRLYLSGNSSQRRLRQCGHHHQFGKHYRFGAHHAHHPGPNIRSFLGYRS